MAEGDLIQTGIVGLDNLVRGGVPRGNVLSVDENIDRVLLTITENIN
jgi:hypothetical protein